ncbi:hypothetical protein V8E55_001100 [Tylopilus felleus]
MTRTKATPRDSSQPEPSSSPPDEVPGPPPSFITSSLTTETTCSDDGAARTMEPITMFTIHRMLVQVLEQTNALWQAQASNNRILDEFRRSIPAPQEYTEINERLRRVEDLAETLSQNPHVDSYPAAQPAGTTSSAYPGRVIPESVSQPAFVRNVGEMPRCIDPTSPGSPPGPIIPTQEAIDHSDRVFHVSGEQ